MFKKIIVLFIVLFVLLGCFGSSSGGDEEVPEVIIITPTASSIKVQILSSPASSGAFGSVDIKFAASETGFNSSDFEYTYELLEGGAIVKEHTLLDYDFDPPAEIYVENNQVIFPNLNSGISYMFKVKARNKNTYKETSFDTAAFVLSDSIINTEHLKDVSINNISIDKVNVRPNEEVTLTYDVSNTGDEVYFIDPLISMPNSEYWLFVSKDNPDRINPNETITFTVKYKLTESVEEQTNLSTLVSFNCKVKAKKDGVEALVPVAGVSKSVTLIVSTKALIRLASAKFSGTTGVMPGESNIRVDYTLYNYSNEEVTIQEFIPSFYDKDGNDVSSEWTLTSDDKSLYTKISPNGSFKTFSMDYTLSKKAKAGMVYPDAMVKVVLDKYGVTEEDSNAEVRGGKEVYNIGTASIEAKVALPSGAIDGTVSKKQDFTIYAEIKYDGNVNFTEKGIVKIDISDLDGARMANGKSEDQISFNTHLEWTVTAPSQVISGNIRIYISKKPEYVRYEYSEELEFEEEFYEIPISVVESSALELEVGVENDNYGGADGILKSGTEFEVYAMVLNTTDTKISGNVKIQFDFNSVTEASLADGESFIKEVAIGTKAIWKVKAPYKSQTGRFLFNVLEVPNDTNTNEKPPYNEQEDLYISAKLGGDLRINKIYCDWETIYPGATAIPIRFELENKGNLPIELIEVKGIFTMEGVDVSDKWIQTDSTIRPGMVIETSGITLLVTSYYKLMDNMNNGSDILGKINISGTAKGKDTISGEEIIDEYPKIDDSIIVSDTIFPISIPTVSSEEVEIGTEVEFDGSTSTDNGEIVSYTWSLYEDEQQVYKGEKVYHTFTKLGTYEISLEVRDEEGNKTTDTVKVIVKDSTAPEAIISVNELTVNVGQSIIFDGQKSKDNDRIKTYEWDFGDGKIGIGQTYGHSFTTVGTYTVQLTAIDYSDNENTASITITVEE